MPTALAALPIVVVILTMALLHWRAALAGAAGLCVALAVILGGDGSSGAAVMVAGVAAEAASSTLSILWIILPALVIYEVQLRSGALERIRLALTRLSDDRAVQAVLIAWFFGLFMEGAAGFGAPVALAAPLLVGLGFSPVRAVTLALLGHAAGVSFGAIGTPALAQTGLLGLPGAQLAAFTMMVHAVPLCLLSVWVMRLATGEPLTRKHMGIALLAALCFLVPALLLAALAGPELPTLGGALIGGAIFAGVMRSQHPDRIEEGKWRLSDLAPYVLIVALVLLTRLIPSVQGALFSLWLGWEWSGFSGGLAPLYHPGTLLAVGLVSATIVSGRGALLGPSLSAALRKLAPVALALLVMLALARLMVHGGLITQLAAAASQAGAFWPLLSPFIGVLGTFVSGSATASNILFTDFQAATARALDLPVVLMAAAQGVGAAIGNAIAPHNIIAGAATVGLSGRDGEVLARTLIPVLIYTASAGVIVLIASRQF